VMLQVAPHEFALMWPAAYPPRKRHVGLPEGADRRGGGPRPSTRAQQKPDGILDLPVGLEDNASIVRIAKANRQMELKAARRALLRMPPCKRARRT
jgi:hypothetical protein